MSINPKILNEIENSISDKQIKKFLLTLLELESKGLPHFKAEYKKKIAEYSEGWKNED